MRKTMSRNIYLSGGTSMLPGLPERLERELNFLLPSSSMVTIHRSVLVRFFELRYGSWLLLQVRTGATLRIGVRPC
jgi:actin-related protein